MEKPSSNLSKTPNTLKFDCFEIPEFVLQTALRELGETQARRETCLTEIKDKIKNEPNFCPNTSENFLLQFLRARKFDTDAAFKLLKKFYKHRQNYPSLYQSYTPKKNLQLMRMHWMSCLPYRTAEGCAIYATKLGTWNPKLFTFEEVSRLGLMCGEQAVKNPITQICGLITVLDFKGFSWSHLFRMSYGSIKCQVSALQGCFPIRHKAIHVVNNTAIFSLLYAVIKPLLNNTIRDRIHFHGDNYGSLHEHIPPELLPATFGGTLGTFHNEEFYSSLLKSEEEFEECSRFGYGVTTTR